MISLTDTEKHWLWGCAVGDGRKQVGRERGDAALARQMVADESDLADFRTFLSLKHCVDSLNCAEKRQWVFQRRGNCSHGANYADTAAASKLLTAVASSV